MRWRGLSAAASLFLRVRALQRLPPPTARTCSGSAASGSGPEDTSVTTALDRVEDEESRLLKIGVKKRPAQEYYLTRRRDRKQEENHAMVLNPGDFQFLKNTIVYKDTKAQRKVKTSLWNHVQSYRYSGNKERYVLLDPELGARIAELILQHSEAAVSKDTSSSSSVPATFVDADGCFCHVARSILRSSGGAFDRVRVFFRDPTLSLMHTRALEYELKQHAEDGSGRLEVRDLNLALMTWDVHSPSYQSPLTSEFSADGERVDWKREVPPFTVFGTVTDGFVKYIAMRTLRGYLEPEPQNEFYWGRHEFFFVVSWRTWHYINSPAAPKESRARYRNSDALIQMLYNVTMVEALPKTSFFPWKIAKKTAKSKNAALFDDECDFDADEFLYLVRLRPKVDFSLSPNATSDNLLYFLNELISKQKTLASQRIIPVAEQWVRGIGMDYIRAGYGLYDTVLDVDVDDLVKLFNMLVDHPDFARSGFPHQAERFFRQRQVSDLNKHTDSETALVNMRRARLMKKDAKL